MDRQLRTVTRAVRAGGLLALLLLTTGACNPKPAGPATTVPLAGAPAAETRSTTGQAPTWPASKVAADTYIEATNGDPESLDPAWTYETGGVGMDLNLYDRLVAFKREKPNEFVPSLATAWTVSDDGKTYTFTLRQGVKFHEGGTLEPHDVAYSLQRFMLQDRSGGPTWLLLKPVLNATSMTDLAVAKGGVTTRPGEAAPSLDKLPAPATTAACQAVLDAAVADDTAGTVTVRLHAPTPWFLQLMATWTGSVLDKEWMVQQGDWDGTCADWMKWYDPPAEKSVLFDRANGTGPYKLVTWKKKEAITLAANDSYWRTEPAWAGGPSGPPRLKHIVVQTVPEWGTRFTMLQSGEVDWVYVPLAEIDQLSGMVYAEYAGADEAATQTVVHPAGTLKLFKGYPTVTADAATFNFAIATEGGNEFIGSGKLDGQGIPPDFFADIHVRKGFNYCFDWQTYIQDALRGDATQTRGPIIQGLQGYRDDSPIYTFDLAKCRDELAQAWGGKLPETGFRLSVAYNEGQTERQLAAEILADGLNQANPKYKVDILKQQWPTLLENTNKRRLPISFAGWVEDYHDASNWVYAYLHSNGAYGGVEGFPPQLSSELDALVDQGVAETDPGKRDAIYAQLQQKAIEEATAIYLYQWMGRLYLRREVTGWYYHPLTWTGGYYVLSKTGP